LGEGHRLLALGIEAQPKLMARLMGRARRRIAHALGAWGHDVWLTSGGTEANALVLAAAAARHGNGLAPMRIVTSDMEHPSLGQGVQALVAQGRAQVQRLPTQPDGRVQLPAPAQLGLPSADLISVMLANNETGVLQPIAELAQLYGPSQAWVHTDAVQAVGRVPVHFTELGVHWLTLAGHKVGAGHSVGAAIVHQHVRWRPPAAFGPSQDALGAWQVASGQCLPGALALAAALEEATARAPSWPAIAAVRDDFEAKVRAQCAPVQILGGASARLPNTSCLRFVGCSAEALLVALDVQGLCVSQGSACSSGVSTASPTIVAMGLTVPEAKEVLRVSWPMDAPVPDLERSAARLLQALGPLCRALRAP
jgi:cysteine desulfurase